MEKQRLKPDSKSCRRLLTVLFFSLLFSTQIYAQVLTLSEVNALRIKPVENQNLYTKTDLKFEVLIPRVKASQVQLLSNDQSADVTVRTMRKNEDYENGGTLVEIWFSFDKKGTYSLNPLQVSIQGRKRSIQFQRVTVTDDPAKQSPRMVIKFNNGTNIYSDAGTYPTPIFTAVAGQKISFTVYIQYATQLMNFNWDIPKDAIFSQTNSYDILEVKYREKNVTHDLIPVASFEWIGLTKGKQKFPKMRITATAYNGSRNEIIIPELEVEFSEGQISNSASNKDNFFDDAFLQDSFESEIKNTVLITPEICNELAEMYSLERHSIFHQTSLKKERQQFELKNNLPVNYKKDYSIRLFIGSLIIFLGAAILLLLSIHEKKPLRILVAIIIMIISIVPTIYGITKRAEKYGICIGCTIYSIPEETAEAKAEMGAGNKVQITEDAGKWYYIELGETGGWCKAENIIIIK